MACQPDVVRSERRRNPSTRAEPGRAPGAPERVGCGPRRSPGRTGGRVAPGGTELPGRGRWKIGFPRSGIASARGSAGRRACSRDWRSQIHRARSSLRDDQATRRRSAGSRLTGTRRCARANPVVAAGAGIPDGAGGARLAGVAGASPPARPDFHFSRLRFRPARLRLLPEPRPGLQSAVQKASQLQPRMVRELAEQAGGSRRLGRLMTADGGRTRFGE